MKARQEESAFAYFALGNARALIAELVRKLPAMDRNDVASDVASLEKLIALALGDREPEAAMCAACGAACEADFARWLATRPISMCECRHPFTEHELGPAPASSSDAPRDRCKHCDCRLFRLAGVIAPDAP